MIKSKARGKTPVPLVLYSANSSLAHAIAERYFRDEHYVWCTPYFDSRSLTTIKVPPTSSPSEIYHALYKESEAGDRHSTKIDQIKVGILKGSNLKRAAGIITAKEQKEIASIVELAETRDFRPLLYIIPYSGVADMLEEVAVEKRAHPLSVEYIIEALPGDKFDVITLTQQ